MDVVNENTFIGTISRVWMVSQSHDGQCTSVLPKRLIVLWLEMHDNLRGEASHDRQKSDKITDMKDHFYINKNDSGCPLYWADDVAYNNDVVWQCKYRADAKREGKKVPIERRTIVLLYTKKNRNVLDAYLGNEFEHGQPHRLKVASEKRVTVTLKKFYYQSAG